MNKKNFNNEGSSSNPTTTWSMTFNDLKRSWTNKLLNIKDILFGIGSNQGKTKVKEKEPERRNKKKQWFEKIITRMLLRLTKT
jgi:hypothetical protein